MSDPVKPDVTDISERMTIPVNLAIDSVAFIDWVRTTIPGILGGSPDRPPERFEIIELGLLTLYNHIMQRIAEELEEQGQTVPNQEGQTDGVAPEKRTP